MPTYAIVKESTVMELTAEEKELIMKHREDAARETRGKQILDEIKEKLNELDALGLVAVLPKIGGAYVTSHHPRVQTDNISLMKDWRK